MTSQAEKQQYTQTKDIRPTESSPPLYDMDLLRHFVETGLVSEYGVQINSCLKRLASASGGVSELDPKTRILSAIACTSGSSMNSVANALEIHHSQVGRAVRDTLASAVYISGEFPSYGIHETVVQRVQVLQRIEDTLNRARAILELPGMQKYLKKIAHVQALLNAYVQDGTVKFLLDNVGVAPYTSYQLRSVGRYILSDQREHALDGISLLATRYAMGRWLIGRGYYTKHSGDELVSLGANYLFTLDPSRLSKRESFRIARMKIFLSNILFQEFTDVQHDPSVLKERGTAFFPTKNGRTAQKKEDIDMEKAYAQYAAAKRAPYRLRMYGELIRDNAPKKVRVQSMHLSQYYDYGWLDTIDWAGVKFLENALRPNAVYKDMTLKRFMQDTTDVLKQAWNETHTATPDSGVTVNNQVPV